MRAVILLILAAGISGCTGLLVSDSRSRVPVMEQDESTGRSPRDNAIATEIEQNLGRDDELRNYTIGVRIRDGNVTLSGAVGSYPARDRAVAIARRANGVRSVDNRIVVNTNL
jgi:osmotically-inducible protein OsmY